MKMTCQVCGHHCVLAEGQTGVCRARKNDAGKIIPVNYGKITSMALDPIEKKPLRRFYPGSKILSVGSFGCNFACPFCQNHMISMTGEGGIPYEAFTPTELVREALAWKEEGNIGIAYTYNEPLIGYEFVRDCAREAKEAGLKNVVVTNGSVKPEVLEEIIPYIDAFNIDLKGFSEEFYRMVKGSLRDVLEFITLAESKSHVEITTLLIPGENDSEEELIQLAQWIAGINEEIPLHLSRFFPCYRMSDREATEVTKVYHLADAAGNYLKYVYTGNC